MGLITKEQKTGPSLARRPPKLLQQKSTVSIRRGVNAANRVAGAGVLHQQPQHNTSNPSTRSRASRKPECLRAQHEPQRTVVRSRATLTLRSRCAPPRRATGPLGAPFRCVREGADGALSAGAFGQPLHDDVPRALVVVALGQSRAAFWARAMVGPAEGARVPRLPLLDVRRARPHARVGL